jgi:hypothetical protein
MMHSESISRLYVVQFWPVATSVKQWKLQNVLSAMLCFLFIGAYEGCQPKDSLLAPTTLPLFKLRYAISFMYCTILGMEAILGAFSFGTTTFPCGILEKFILLFETRFEI